MDAERVDALLASYKQNIGRAEHLRAQIKDAELRIKDLEKYVICVGASRCDGMPRSTKISDPTGNMGAAIADGVIPLTEHTKWMESNIDNMKRDLAEVEVEIQYVRAWLKALNVRERWLIERQVIEEMSWRDVVKWFNERFSEDANKDRLKKIKARAKEKIYDVAG